MGTILSCCRDSDKDTDSDRFINDKSFTNLTDITTDTDSDTTGKVQENKKTKNSNKKKKQDKKLIVNSSTHTATTTSTSFKPSIPLPLLPKKVDPHDYLYSHRSSDTIMREAGTIEGQAIAIENCTDCIILLCDYVGTCTVDEW